MPKAARTPTTSRRSVLAAAPGLILAAAAPAAVAAPSDDAELIGLCDRFIALQERIVATHSGAPFGSAASLAAEQDREALLDAQDPLFDRICALQATTPAGILARARMLRSWDLELEDNGAEGGYWNHRMVWSLVRDLTG